MRTRAMGAILFLALVDGVCVDLERASASPLQTEAPCQIVVHVPSLTGGSDLNYRVAEGALFSEHSNGKFCGSATLATPFGDATSDDCFHMNGNVPDTAAWGNKVISSTCKFVDPATFAAARRAAPSASASADGGLQRQARPTPGAKGAWEVQSMTSQLTGAADYSAVLHSSNEMPNAIGAPETAGLVVRCKGGALDLYVAWPAFMNSEDDVEVMWKFDQGEIWKQAWSPSKDGEGTFVPNPRDFLNAISSATKLVIDASPYERTTMEAVFDVTGADKVAYDAEALCPG